MPTELLTTPERQPQRLAERPAAEDHRQQRVRRVKLNIAAWGFGSSVLTALWVGHEWQANGFFERFAHEGNRGDWNPTLWALAVLLWGLVVGIMALRLYFESTLPMGDDHLARLRFHAATWLLGMVVLIPVNALIEWQDNGGFERFSRDSRPGSWDPWILPVGAVWALVIAVVFALPVYLDRRRRRW